MYSHYPFFLKLRMGGHVYVQKCKEKREVINEVSILRQ